MQQLIKDLDKRFEWLNFQAGKQFCWSPKNSKVNYKKGASNPEAKWSLLHEVSHAILHHTHYNDDFDLLQLEVSAWHQTHELAKQYNVEINEEYVQDCLDTYRDWLHMRSACPNCGQQSLQTTRKQYRCFNCRNSWQVSNSRLCRTYRFKNKSKAMA